MSQDPNTEIKRGLHHVNESMVKVYVNKTICYKCYSKPYYGEENCVRS